MTRWLTHFLRGVASLIWPEPPKGLTRPDFLRESDADRLRRDWAKILTMKDVGAPKARDGITRIKLHDLGRKALSGRVGKP